jgi:ribosome-associated protein
MDPIVVNERVTIPARDLRYRAVRSSGPGGQNVNKVSSKIELELDTRCAALDEWTRTRLHTLAGNKIDNEGWLHVVCQASRDQGKNLIEAREKLATLIREAMSRPKPRRPTKPSRGSKERRLTAKKQNSERKSNRRSIDD